MAENNTNNEQPLISIGIPTYAGHGKDMSGLRHTLTRMLGQTYKNIEIVVSDNASPTDDVVNTVTEFSQNDSRVKYVRQQENLGIWGNFNYLIQNASGEFFIWAADDDDWSDTFIEYLYDKIQKDNDLVIAMSNHQYMLPPDMKRLPYIPENRQYLYKAKTPLSRLLQNFTFHPNNNILYGLIRRQQLLSSVESIFRYCNSGSFPFCLAASSAGNIQTFEEIHFFPATWVSGYRRMANWFGVKIPDEIKDIQSSTDIDKVVKKTLTFLFPRISRSVDNNAGGFLHINKFVFNILAVILRFFFKHQESLEPLSVAVHAMLAVRETTCTLWMLSSIPVSHKIICMGSSVINGILQTFRSGYITIKRLAGL